MIVLVNEELYDLPGVDVIEVIKQNLVWYGCYQAPLHHPHIVDITVLCLILSTILFFKESTFM